MNVLILSSPYPHESAGNVAIEVLNCLRSNNRIETKLLVKDWGKFQDEDVISLDSKIEYYKNWVIKKVKGVFKKLGVITSELQKTDGNFIILDYDNSQINCSSYKLLKKYKITPDLIIVLFMANFLSFKNIYELSDITGAPVMLFMMDMSNLTGGCHYAWNCDGYLKECGMCPALYSNDPLDQSNKNWKFNKGYIDKTNITLIAGSEWQWKQANKSSLFKDKVKVKILAPTNELLFSPGDKETAREKLGLPVNKKIILFGAENQDTKRKGINELREALIILRSKLSDEEISNVHLIFAGKDRIALKNQLTFEYTFLGFLSIRQLAVAYQAADLFLNASIEDSGPTMINQSIMSGTPVVAFEMGVAPDLVINGVTGYRAKLKDSKDYANGILSILRLSEAEYKKMSSNCRELALTKCSHKKVASDYVNLINNITDNGKKNRNPSI